MKGKREGVDLGKENVGGGFRDWGSKRRVCSMDVMYGRTKIKRMDECKPIKCSPKVLT